MREEDLSWWSLFVDLCKKLKNHRDRESILKYMVNVEITLIGSLGKRSWMASPNKGVTQRDSKSSKIQDKNLYLVKVKKYAVHFMFPVAAFVEERLPDIDTVSFLIAHWYCVIESTILPEEEISNILDSLQKKLIDSAIAEEHDPIRLLAEELQGLLKSIFEIWSGPGDSVGKRKMRGVLLVMDSQGEIVKDRTKYLPTKRTRKAYCQKLFEFMMGIDAIRDYLLRQSFTIKIEKKFLETFRNQHVPPLHIGWIGHRGRYFHFGYFNNELNYGNLIQMWPKGREERLKDFDWELPFRAIPLEVSIPLFAYDLFSIMKYFVPGYPSRITLTEPFISVRAKRKKLIFMSLSGSGKEQIAEAYCGMFSKYDYDSDLVSGESELPPELSQIYPSRVHDGVTILKAPYKNYRELEDYDLLQDACCLCLNVQFDRPPNEISLRVDTAPDKSTLDKINFIIIGMIKGFVTDLERRYKKMRDSYSIQWAEDMARRFDALYGKACNLLKIQPEFCGIAYWKERFGRNRDVSWEDVKVFNNMLNTYFRKLQTEPNYRLASQQESFEVNKSRDTMTSGSKMVDNLYLLFQKFNHVYKKKIEKDTLDKITWLNEARYIMGNCPSQYIYLYAAVRSFCMYLNDAEERLDFSHKLIRWTRQVLTDLSKQTVDIFNTFSLYLSQKLEAGMIVCSRTTQEGEISGWYDNKKHLIYLPYENYFRDFMKYWNVTYKYTFPYTQEKFQKELLKKQVLVVHESQRKGGYIRCQCRVVVAPPKEDQPSEQRPVLKVDAGKLKLSIEAEQQLKEMDKIIVSRRRKTTKNQTTK